MFYCSIKLITLEIANAHIFMQKMIVIICIRFEKNGLDVISEDTLYDGPAASIRGELNFALVDLSDRLVTLSLSTERIRLKKNSFS